MLIQPDFIIVAIVAVVALLLLFLLRAFLLWYWRINQIVEEQRRQTAELAAMRQALERLIAG